MLNILILSPWLPWPPYDGARIRILETLRFLSQRHRVSLIAPLYRPEEEAHVGNIRNLCADSDVVLVPNGTSARLRRLCSGLAAGLPPVQAYHRNAAMAERVRNVTSETSFDIVHVEFSFLAHYLGALSPRCQARTVLSMHNIESTRFDRELAVAPWNTRRLVLLGNRSLFPNWEQRAVRAFDGVLAVSEDDRAWIKDQAPAAAVRLAPNGVDVEYYAPWPVSSVSSSVVYVGAMDYPPNEDAVVWFADEILPSLRAGQAEMGFTIVGRSPTPAVKALARRPGIRVTGEVEDIRPYLAEAVALVVPLRSGGGTRLKILQAMAMGRPVVSTALGAEGLEIADGDNIVIADSPERFAECVVRLAIAPDMAARIGLAGRQLALAKYDWRQCLQGLEDLYQVVLTDRRA
jgi:sugar transferase (PEP-CTERM/EpsH1 system associated)